LFDFVWKDLFQHVLPNTISGQQRFDIRLTLFWGVTRRKLVVG
jgi:hypothetical protein